MLTFKRALFIAVLAAGTVAAHAQYSEFDLTSSPGALLKTPNVDENLINPWGIAYSPSGPFWICDNGTSLSTVYDSNGAPYPNGSPVVVNIPPFAESGPTGIAYNGTTGFLVSSGGTGTPPPGGKGGGTGPSVFIFVSEAGTISGWNPGVNPSNAIVAVDRSENGAVYKGAAMAVNRGKSFLFATNFASHRVECYDSNWNMVGAFTDPYAPNNYSPFGIANINGFLLVTYAMKNPQGNDDVPGTGHGFIDVFQPNGQWLRRFATQGVLNSPWGMCIAPHHFGEFHDRLLVGNFGNGRINVFDFPNGFSRGPLLRNTGGQITGGGHTPIVIPGLWGLIVGNGGLGGSRENVYFTAGISGGGGDIFGGLETGGLFGYIAPFRSQLTNQMPATFAELLNQGS